jgi:hypothetical protein
MFYDITDALSSPFPFPKGTGSAKGLLSMSNLNPVTDSWRGFGLKELESGESYDRACSYFNRLSSTF